MRTTTMTASVTITAGLVLALGACGNSQETTSTQTTTVTASADASASPASASSSSSASADPTSATSSAASSDADTDTDADADAQDTGSADDGRREYLTEDGGFIVDGSTVTFVYTNGVQYTADIGTPIGDLPFTHVGGGNTVALTEDGTSALALGTVNVTFDAESATGDILDADGAMSITKTSTSCAQEDNVSLVNADGSGAQTSQDGIVVVGKDGVLKYTTGDVTKSAGRFTACNVDATSKIDLSGDVLFDFGKATLTPAGTQVINSVAAQLKDKASTATVTGHTDWVGTITDNEDLGQRRADAVAAQLKKKAPALSTTTDSLGETRPVAPNAAADGSDNPQGRQLNRRVEIAFKK